MTGIVVRHQAYYLVRGSGAKETKAASAFRLWLMAELAQSAQALRAAATR